MRLKLRALLCFCSTGYLPTHPTTTIHPYDCLRVHARIRRYHSLCHLLLPLRVLPVYHWPTHTFTDTLPFVVSGYRYRLRCIRMGRSARLHCHSLGYIMGYVTL